MISKFSMEREILFYIIVDKDKEVMKEETIPKHTPQSNYQASRKATLISKHFTMNNYMKVLQNWSPEYG